MSRYIDADKLMHDLKNMRFTVMGLRAGKTLLIEQVQTILNEIYKVCNEQPTADVAEVVRCRDCKHSRDEKQPHYCEVWRRYKIVNGNGFCIYGERKVQE